MIGRSSKRKAGSKRTAAYSPDHPIAGSPDRTSLPKSLPVAHNFPPSQAPGREAFLPEEWAIIQRCRTPKQVQEYLRKLPYNWEKHGETLRTFRGVVRHRSAHCLEGALSAATIMERHGYPRCCWTWNLRINWTTCFFSSRRTGVGHHRALAGCRTARRKPVFRTIRHLVISYVDPFRRRLRTPRQLQRRRLADAGQGRSAALPEQRKEVEHALIKMAHTPIRTSQRRHDVILRRLPGPSAPASRQAGHLLLQSSRLAVTGFPRRPDISSRAHGNSSDGLRNQPD